MRRFFRARLVCAIPLFILPRSVCCALCALWCEPITALAMSDDNDALTAMSSNCSNDLFKSVCRNASLLSDKPQTAMLQKISVTVAAFLCAPRKADHNRGIKIKKPNRL